MSRTVLCCAALAFVLLPCRADDAAATPETLIRLTLRPAAAPKPALRYQLLPEYRELSPGNSVQGYLKCFMEQQKFFFDKEAFEHREKLLGMPLKELPARELREYGGLALRQADWAARLDNPDWQILLNMKAEGPYLLIPDVQQIRPLGNALKVRMRAEVALGRFDDALRTAKTMFAVSRHLGEHPTFVGNLIGMVLANTAIGPLEEMLEEPGCPNLYWALTHLPSPLIALDKGKAGERFGIIQWSFRDLSDSDPMSADQVNAILADKDKLLELGDGKAGKLGVRAWLDARTKDQGAVSAARRRLVETGLSEARVRLFPADQVMLLDEKRELEARFDDLMKTVNLPVWQAELLGTRYKRTEEPALFADALGPAVAQAVAQVVRSRGRLDQRIALLRHVEALRLHAAGHNGSLPAKLSEISVPLPDDPFTGKPFRYELIGGTAHLQGTPPPGMEKDPAYNVHYEVTLQK